MKAVALVFVLALLASCGADAGSCQRQLDLCLRKSPPGASTSDCYAQYDECTRLPRKSAQAESQAEP